MAPSAKKSKKRNTTTRNQRSESSRRRIKRRKYDVSAGTVLSIAANLLAPPPPSPPPPEHEDSVSTALIIAGQHDHPQKLWELPHVILYHIAGFVAPPTQRAAFVCKTLAPLCRSAYHSLMVDQDTSKELWTLILSGDYGTGDNSSHQFSSPKKGRRHKTQTIQRRSCARLRRSHIEQVRDAHILMRDNTEIAYHFLSELSSSTAKNSLTRSKLISILEEYGPNLMCDRTMSSGGAFLVEVCRCRNATANSILQCVEHLVNVRGCNVNIQTHESSKSSLTPLCVAAVRGLPKVVAFLLQHGASKHQRSCGSFKLHFSPRKSLRCNDVTPSEFASNMKTAELREDARIDLLKGLTKCIQLLSE